jgi:hypothetical protein
MTMPTDVARMTPEALAHAALAKAAYQRLPDGRVRLDLNVTLTVPDAERLTALAIARAMNLDALVAEILETYVRQRAPGPSARPRRRSPGHHAIGRRAS